jgi:hypothetical protein
MTNQLGKSKGSIQCACMKLPDICYAAWITACLLACAEAKEWNFTLAYKPGPPDNPLKGLVPYAGEGRDRFPHSMEFSYLALNKVVVSRDQYDWTPLDRLLNEVSGRGNQTIFRFYMEYPGKGPATPEYLWKEGVKRHVWTFEGEDQINTPDYSDPRVRDMLTHFIAALGQRYDGDPRIGFIHAGLLGLWGEWHDWPRENLFAPKQTQKAVLDAYETNFRRTRVLLRYPAGASDPVYTPNSDRPFGYHDDSFAWATLDTGRSQDDWFFVPLLRSANATATWKSQPIGGEIRPEAWGKVFDAQPADKRIQNFATCVTTTHASWLMDTGMFRIPPEDQPAGRVSNAVQMVSGLGYDLHVQSALVRLNAKKVLSLELKVQNRGVAPFYDPWRVDYALLDSSGKIRTLRSHTLLNGILPGTSPVLWTEKWRVRMVPPGPYTLMIRGHNPMPGGHPVRFANTSQDIAKEGWLSLGLIQL